LAGDNFRMAARFCIGIGIGIAVHAGPGGLLEMLRLIGLHTNPGVQAVFLPESPAPPQ